MAINEFNLSGVSCRLDTIEELAIDIVNETTQKEVCTFASAIQDVAAQARMYCEAVEKAELQARLEQPQPDAPEPARSGDAYDDFGVKLEQLKAGITVLRVAQVSENLGALETTAFLHNLEDQADALQEAFIKLA